MKSDHGYGCAKREYAKVARKVKAFLGSVEY